MTNAAVAEKTKVDVQSQDHSCKAAQGKSSARRVVVPHYDIYSREGSYEVLTQLPGVSHEGLTVEVENQLLTVKGTAVMPSVEGLKPLHTEFSLPDYHAAFRIPAEVDTDKVEAVLENGVLSLKLGLRERKRQTVEIKAS